jgi:hypothetical protein
MYLDVAYALRARLRRMGYEFPEIIGLLLIPPADTGTTAPQALGNTYASLIELNHYSRPDTTFVAQYDERFGAIREKAAPFTQCYLLPGSAVGLNPPVGMAGAQGTPRSRTPTGIAVPTNRPRPSGSGSGSVTKPGSRVLQMGASQRSLDPTAAQAALKPYSDAAELIRLSVLSPVGRLVDEGRVATEDGKPHAITFAAFGISGFEWPRAEVVARTASKVGRSILKRWASPDIKRMREVIPAIAQERWSQLGLDPDSVLGHLQQVADQAAGGKVEELIDLTTEPLIPRGWLARLPDPDKLTVAIDRLVKLVGPPASTMKRSPTTVELALAQAAFAIGEGIALDIRAIVPTLIDDPQFRLSGTEELMRQFLATTDRLMERYLQSSMEQDAKAQIGFECISQYAHYHKGMRKPAAAEFTEALKQYPHCRFQAIIFRQMVAIYQSVRDSLNAQMTDVSAARQRLEIASNLTETTTAPVLEPIDVPAGGRRLMPAGCNGIADAVQKFLGVLNDSDTAEIDRRAQAVIEPKLGGLFQGCMNSANGPAEVVAAVFEETRAHLDTRLGEVDLAGMFAERYRTPQQAERAIEQTYQEAEPTWVGSGPWVGGEVSVLACPGGPGGEPLRELARRAIPVAGLPIADSRDTLTVYREWPSVPLAALPHVGPAALAAYAALPDTQQCTPHSRVDVTQWVDVDAK